jgi:hypothetical protein
LIWLNEEQLNALSPTAGEALTAECLAYDDALRDKGCLIAAHALQSGATATMVQIRNGKVSITDGPFVETNEQVGGFVLIEVADLNDAIQVATKHPLARFGSIEVRPIWQQPQQR